MSAGEFVLPLAVAVLVGLAAAGPHRRVSPRLAAPILLCTTLILGAAVTVIALSWSVTFLAHRPAMFDIAGWCRHVAGTHDATPGWLGALATGFVALGTVRTVRVIRRWRSFHRADRRPIEVVRSDQLFAYTLPGSGCQIVVSSGLIDTLDPDEFRVVVAHENAHGRHRHDRYLLGANLAVALAPWVRPLQRRLEFSLERWADDAAAREMGGDRELVAGTLARVALAHASVPAGALAFSGLSVIDRIEALQRPPARGPLSFRALTMAIGAVVVAASAVLQLHHVGAWLLALCWP